MRYLTIYLLGVVTVTGACQPIKSTDINITLADPSPVIKTPEPIAKQELAATPSISKNQNESQIEMELVIGDITSGNETKPILAKPTSIAPQIVMSAPKNFNPTDIIGFEIPEIIRDLGHANFIRHEGLIEIWQYHFTSCVVDFFFYPITESVPKLIAKSWDMRSAMLEDSLDETSCLDEINIYHQDTLNNP